MTEINGLLFDGKNIKKTPVVFTVNNKGDACLSTVTDEFFRFSKIAISPRIGDSTRFLTLPSGQLFETDDNDKVDDLINLFSENLHSHIHTDARFIRISVMAVILLLSWMFISLGVPALTYKIAMKVPEKMLIEYGQGALKDLDDKYFSKSKITDKRQQTITKRFKELLPDEHRKLAYNLHFREVEKIGANAFALPSGDIIISDNLIELSMNNDEIMSILLHEIAHVELRHAVQGVIRTSSILLFVVAVTGDITSLSAALVGVPALLLNSNYSRQMEWDADGYSLKKMQSLDINPAAFSSILSKIVAFHKQKKIAKKDTVNKDEEKQSPKETQSDDQYSGYWSSHPPSKERIERFRKAGELFQVNG